ncbi:30S ribosomal protein S4 [Candidatus Kapabacteria bacterium]|nr:30S ribosomal protein S4 [Candidatus Kapabacteria bacterium]
MKYNGPKVKISRKIGIQITPKATKIVAKKNYPPGQHGPSKRRSKQSDYGKQLLEKQRLRLQYNISEKQMRKYYSKAVHLTGNTGDLFMQLLERRLDAVILRSGLAKTIYAARQYVGHGHVLVNGKPVRVPSYEVKTSDDISIKEKSRKLECFQESVRSSHAPEYLEVSKTDFSVKYVHVPAREDIPIECEIPLVVEYYSR